MCRFRGSAPAQIDLLAGNVVFMIDNLTGIVGHIAVRRGACDRGDQRRTQRRCCPTCRRCARRCRNSPAYEVNTWFGVFGPAGLPADAVGSLNAEIAAMVGMPETQRRFTELGGFPMHGSAEEFAAFVRSEITKWAEVIRREGLTVDAG